MLVLSIDKSRPGLRNQIVSELSKLIFDGFLKPEAKLPSCRVLARQLNLSVNTVIGAYQLLEADQLIRSQARSGYFVAAEIGAKPAPGKVVKPKSGRAAIGARMNAARMTPHMDTIHRPHDWHAYRYPFVCNQIEIDSFPVAEWRECTRLTMSRKDLPLWSCDGLYADAPELIEQVCARILPRRGIFVPPSEILITLGAQNGIYIAACLFGGRGRVAAMEDPGYPDARKILAAQFDDLRYMPVDDEGIMIGEHLAGIDLLYVTPNRQFPTTVCMTEPRRKQLLKAADTYDFYIIEDDYECDADYRVSLPLPLHKLDPYGRILYVGSLSKGFAPGLRLGYLVGPPDFLKAAKDCRGTMLRHPPPQIQMTAALFLRFGHYDALLARVRRGGKQKWDIANTAIRQLFTDFDTSGSYGGTSFMLRKKYAPLDVQALVRNAREVGIIIESTAPCFADRAKGAGTFRLGVASIGAEHIVPGLTQLRAVIDA